MIYKLPDVEKFKSNSCLKFLLNSSIIRQSIICNLLPSSVISYSFVIRCISVAILLLTRLHVQFQGNTIVTDCHVDLPDAIITAATVKVRICVLGVKFNHLSEICDGLHVVSESLKRDSSVVKSVDVWKVDLEHSCVVSDCLMIMTKFSETVCSIVECFHIVLGTEFNFVRVVFDGLFEAFEFSIHEASVWVDYWIWTIKFNCLVKV